MKKPLLLLSALALCVGHAYGKERIYLDDKFDVEKDSIIHIDVPVGSVEIETHDSDQVVIDIVVKEKNDGWFGGDDIEDAELEKDISGKKVRLEVDVDESQQEWRVKLPKSANIRVELGVGQVELENVERDVMVDVGVGEVDVELTDDNYRKISLESGVGGADLSGFKQVDRERAMVSESLYWRGEGEYLIDIEVGVGDIDVNL
ncbi:MAG: hypothetical protein GJ680_17545 [Alteromonadaceae bacterium]|nr:hypothetical protein [Alteromonadaceae bacterium]